MELVSMAECVHCGTDGSFLYTCPDCGGRFCDEHLELEAHGCSALSEEPGVEGREATDEDDESGEEPDAGSTAEMDIERADEVEYEGDELSSAPGTSEPPEAADSRLDDEPSDGLLRRIPILRRLFD